jgi:hypothetical protein
MGGRQILDLNIVANRSSVRQSSPKMRELRRRSAIEPIIGHLKAEGHRAAASSKAAPTMPPTSAVGHNFRRILA